MGNKFVKDRKLTAVDNVRKIPNGLWSYRAVDALTEEFLPKDTEWHQFTDIEQTIIEKAHEERKIKLEIDLHTIDLIKNIQVHKIATARKSKIKREREGILLPIRYNRFHLHPLLEFTQYIRAKNNRTGRTLIMPYVWKWYQQGGGHESMGDGLLTEGRLAKREYEAIWIIEQLMLSSRTNYEIRLTALAIFTLESFLCPLIQTTLRTNDITKMSTLGPFIALLGDCRTYSAEIDRLLYSGMVYFSSNHDVYQIKTQFRKYINTEECIKVDTFISATKIRSIAEQAADVTCLFIVHIKHRRNVNAIDISSLSRRPQEQEVLILPNVPFHVKKVECPSNNLHQHIVYLTVEN